MKLPTSTIFLCLGLLALSLLGARQARATLGEGADSIARDKKALSAVKRATTSFANYTVQEIASDATTVREFITPAGVVFAVAWNGLVHPDFSTLLGAYTDEYKSAKKQLPRQHGKKSSRVQSGRVVVETWGHMGNLQGRAYLPALVPEGVKTDEIR